ncbi:MAG TPA: sporulation protein [Candidatus Saccharimonadales bacterium]|nr:sporulation protein [Candidatus Saccharimonadales bacterium]
MGLFGKLKQFGEQMDAASQLMLNSQLTVTLNNPQVKIGEQVSGTITITSKTPCTIKDFQISLLRELGDLQQVGRLPSESELTGQTNKNQWIFNKETIPGPFQIQAGETKTVPFTFVVKDGTEFQSMDKGVFGKVTPFGVNPAVIPDVKDGAYTHKLTVMAQLEGVPIGPTGGVDNINFVYPTFNPGLTLGDSH